MKNDIKRGSNKSFLYIFADLFASYMRINNSFIYFFAHEKH